MSLNSAIIGIKIGATTVRHVIRNYGVKGSDLKYALDALQKYEETSGHKLISSIESKSLERWVAAYCNVKIDNSLPHTPYTL